MNENKKTSGPFKLLIWHLLIIIPVLLIQILMVEGQGIIGQTCPPCDEKKLIEDLKKDIEKLETNLKDDQNRLIIILGKIKDAELALITDQAKIDEYCNSPSSTSHTVNFGIKGEVELSGEPAGTGAKGTVGGSGNYSYNRTKQEPHEMCAKYTDEKIEHTKRKKLSEDNKKTIEDEIEKINQKIEEGKTKIDELEKLLKECEGRESPGKCKKCENGKVLANDNEDPGMCKKCEGGEVKPDNTKDPCMCKKCLDKEIVNDDTKDPGLCFMCLDGTVQDDDDDEDPDACLKCRAGQAYVECDPGYECCPGGCEEIEYEWDATTTFYTTCGGNKITTSQTIEHQTGAKPEKDCDDETQFGSSYGEEEEPCIDTFQTCYSEPAKIDCYEE